MPPSFCNFGRRLAPQFGPQVLFGVRVDMRIAEQPEKLTYQDSPPNAELKCSKILNFDVENTSQMIKRDIPAIF
jgi:hypothetical protein